MPELPEVESLRRSLEPTLIGARVERVRVARRDVIVVPGDPPGGFSRQRVSADAPRKTRRPKPKPLLPGDLLDSDRIARTERHGKQFAIVGETGRCVVVQLGMSGQVLTGAPGTRLPDHAHVRWLLETKTGPVRLVFRDPRRFGGLRVFRSENDLRASWSDLGLDALSIPGDAFAAALRRTRRSLKACLLDQAVVAGVGNIYADEACHAAGLHPMRLATSVTPDEAERLAVEIRRLLGRAIELGGSTLRDYRNASGEPGRATSVHRVYGRASEPCSTCGSPIQATSHAGRTTAWCPQCQPLSRGLSTTPE